MTSPGGRSSALVSVLDFPETMLQIAGEPVPDDMQGASLVPLLQGRVPDDWRTSFYYHYYEFPGAHSVRRHYGVVTDRYKLFYFYEPDMDYWTLIDRQTDPRELTNQYENPAYARTVKQLHAELDRLRAELQVPAQDPPESFRRRRRAKRKGT